MKALKITFTVYGQKYFAYAPAALLRPLEGEMTPKEFAQKLAKDCYACDMAELNIELCDVYYEYERKELEKEIDLWPKYDKSANVFIGSGETVVCEETGLEVYRTTAYMAKMHSTPYSEADEMWFCNAYAFDCYCGRMYSKDFAYFTCDKCGRLICEQNPANGWHIQYRWMEDSQVCDKCYQENMLESGIEYSELFRTHELQGSFFVEKELIENGYVVHEHFNGFLVGHGKSGYNDPNNFWKQLAAHSELNGKKLVINYESMSVGGMGGYISLWYK